MKIICLSTACLVIASSLSIAASTSFSRGTTLANTVGRTQAFVLEAFSSRPKASLWGVVPRGGGLFGGKSDEKSEEAESASSSEGTVYPAMTQQEIEDWLEHIPIFAVTDSNGAGVVLKPENDTSVFYFFFNPMQANATLQQLKMSNTELDLKVSAFSLGRVWFSLINAQPETEIQLTLPGSGETTTETTKGVEYRLVPDTRDLMGARMLLTMSPEDGEKLKDGGQMTPEMAQAAIQKAMTESPKFKTTFNEIPVFTIAQMRMVKQAESKEDGEDVTLMPMYFSLQNMVGTWQQFIAGAGPDLQGVEPAINLMSLHDIIDMMQKESRIDWRHVVLVPSAPDSMSSRGASSTTTTAAAAADPMATMGGATLGDDE